MNLSIGTPESQPPNDLTVPLTSGDSQLELPRMRQGSMFSEGLSERAATMRIDIDAKRKKEQTRPNRFPQAFRLNAEMAVRVACGVVLASAIQTRDPDYDSSVEHSKKWLLFPSWYYLGGLSYCAMACIFASMPNTGATIQQVCQGFYGTGLALLYNIVLFAIYDVQMYDASAADPYAGFSKIDKAFSSSSYWINQHNFYMVLPWIMVFTVGVLMLPIDDNTKKFALGYNLYFALTIINPADPLDSSKLKAAGDSYFDTNNILYNLSMYFVVGVLGTLISLMAMLIPYPVFAINLLRAETKKASEDILDLLNLILDSYCYKNKDMDHMNFLQADLRRKFNHINARHQKITELLEFAWWEQLFGFHLCLNFNRSVIKNYVRLLKSLVGDLQSLNNAMQLEKYEQLHLNIMKSLQRDIYGIQVKSGILLEEIAKEVHTSTLKLNLQSMAPLIAQTESMLQRYRVIQSHVLRQHKPTLKDVEGNVPLNLFVFSLNSFASSLIGFQDTHNERNHLGGIRARAFLFSSIASYFDPNQYTRLRLISALKVSLAILIGTFMAVYVYGYSSTAPAAIAYVMGNHIGGSFGLTVNRVGGVVAGSVVPSVFQFFITQVCSPAHLNTIMSESVLFIWVTISMYVYFAGGYTSYGGLVSAFIAAGILLTQSDACTANSTSTSSTVALSSYSSLAQNSVGMVIFIVVELVLWPESATNLLRKNIQTTLKTLQESFSMLFGHHLSTNANMDSTTLSKIRSILHVQLPALLQEQKRLLLEAKIEPMLWRQTFSFQKYELVLQNCSKLLNDNNLLFKLMRWFSFRAQESKWKTRTMDIRDGVDSNIESSFTKWKLASNQLLLSVEDTFKTFQLLFGEDFLYADAKDTAIFMQMKEAFRLADKDGSGEIDSDEVAMMLESIITQSGGIKEHDIQRYVDEFMSIVDKDNSGLVTFEEFMEALDSGLTIEVEVYHRRKRKVSVLQNATLLGSIIEGAEESRTEQRRHSMELNRPPSLSRMISTDPSVRGTILSPIWRQHDVLNVEEFTLGEVAATMKSAYVQWLMEGNRFEYVSMEELLLLNCLVSGSECIARNLTDLEETLVSN